MASSELGTPTSLVKTLSSDRHTRYKRCPVKNCMSKPQKRVADHIRICHPHISPGKRKLLCRVARAVPKKHMRPLLGQKKLTFSQPSKSPSPGDLIKPVFSGFPEARPLGRESTALALQPGRKASTRNIGSFPMEHEKLADFRRYLMCTQSEAHCKSNIK